MPKRWLKPILRNGQSQFLVSWSLSPWVPGPAMSWNWRGRSRCPVSTWVISIWPDSYWVAVNLGSSSFSDRTVQFTIIHVLTPIIGTEKQGTRSHSLSPASSSLELFLSPWPCFRLALVKCWNKQAQSRWKPRGEFWLVMCPLTFIQQLWDPGLTQAICQIINKAVFDAVESCHIMESPPSPLLAFCCVKIQNI